MNPNLTASLNASKRLNDQIQQQKIQEICDQLSIAHKALSEANAMAQELGEDERLFGLADFKESIADAFHYTDAAIDLSHNLKNQDDV